MRDIIRQLGGTVDPDSACITQLTHEEDGEPYQVWRIDAPGGPFILKEAKEYEAAMYRDILKDVPESVPRIYAEKTIEGKTYLLMEYVQGSDLRLCTREKLKKALDALISMQRTFWDDRNHAGCGCPFEASLDQRRNRGRYLKDPVLEAAYAGFLAQYESLPRTLCHDDLLPFNVLTAEDRAVLIDWECGGILPYPTSFVRLIAHGEEKEGAFFFMKQEDREYAIAYYYDRLLVDKGISRSAWQETLDYFLLYEYCEWVMVGNKYGTTDGAYFKKYLPMAKAQAEKILTRQQTMGAASSFRL